jgi:TerC family integral membrane protein
MLQFLPWLLFYGFVGVCLWADLKVFHRKPHEVSLREAALLSVFWIGLSLAFNVVVFFLFGSVAAVEFFTAYLVEKALSADNLFVFLTIFSYFQVPHQYRHRVLFWGVFGAIVMRSGILIAGTALIATFHWLIYVLAAILLLTTIRMALSKEDDEADLSKNWVLRFFRRFIPMTQGYEGMKFLVMRAGRILATPLLLVLVIVETTDLIFATDSIPAVLAITQKDFIANSSNICAILGLRSLYFVVQGMIGQFSYLKPGLIVILGGISVKMLVPLFTTIFLGHEYEIPIGLSLAFIGIILAGSILASVYKSWREGKESSLQASQTIEEPVGVSQVRDKDRG